MNKPKAQRTHEFTIRVVFDKAVTRAVAKKEAHGSLVGFSDWTLDECAAETLKVTALRPVAAPAPQPQKLATRHDRGPLPGLDPAAATEGKSDE